ncbi:MAG: hypothetical protein HY958_10830 [Bacteroidia bacterium]|nr:hypothetical protein [Bacteroidia bacterium]
MKTIHLILAISILSFGIAYSQDKEKDKGDEKKDKKERKNKIKAQKIAFITNKLDLSPEEAQVFWPVYNEYQKKIEDIGAERMKLMRDIKKNSATLSDKEMETIADKIVEQEMAEASLLKEYHQKFKKVLPKSKVLKLYQSEHQFKKQLLRDMRGRHEGGVGGG